MTVPTLKAEALVLASGKSAIDMSVAAGEIVGLAGLDGHGQEHFLKSLAGLERPAGGRVLISDAEVSGFRDAVAKGIAYLPRDRRATGVFPSLSVLDNFSMATLEADCRGGLIKRTRSLERYEDYRDRLSIVAPGPNAPITTLSGGNQQKVLLARWLALKPKVLLLNDPTRGVDIATRKVLYGVFRDLAHDGMTLAILSTEIEEIVALCRRVHVFRDQELCATLEGEAMVTDRVMAAMFGQAVS